MSETLPSADEIKKFIVENRPKFYTSIFVEYGDQLTEKQVTEMVSNPQYNPYEDEDFNAWVSEASYNSEKEEWKEMLRSIEHHFNLNHFGLEETLEIILKDPNLESTRDEFVEYLQSIDDSDPFSELIDVTPEVLVRVPLSDIDNGWSFALPTAEHIADRLGISITDPESPLIAGYEHNPQSVRNFEAIQELIDNNPDTMVVTAAELLDKMRTDLPNAVHVDISDDPDNLNSLTEMLINSYTGYRQLHLVFGIELSELNTEDARDPDALITVSDPTLYLGNPYDGDGWYASALDGSITVRRSQLRTDADQIGWAFEEIFGSYSDEYASVKITPFIGPVRKE